LILTCVGTGIGYLNIDLAEYYIFLAMQWNLKRTREVWSGTPPRLNDTDEQQHQRMLFSGQSGKWKAVDSHI